MSPRLRRVTRRAIGLVPQELNFDPFFTVEESLRIQAGYFGVRLAEERQAAAPSPPRQDSARASATGAKLRSIATRGVDKNVAAPIYLALHSFAAAH